MIPLIFNLALLFANSAIAYDSTFAFKSSVEHENRTIDEIYKAALAEGGVVTVWHGGDEKTQQDSLKAAFEKQFPGMTLNITVDLSKYHDGNLDQQLANGNVYVDSIILQTLHDYPRWKEEGALLNYAPVNFSKIFPAFRDVDAAYHGMYVFGWSNVWNIDKTDATPKEFTDYLKPEYKDKLVITYPNDDDAVLFAFDLIMQQYGYAWFDSLLAQNPRWVRGTATPVTLIGAPNTSYVASFSSSIGVQSSPPLNVSFPSEGTFVTWPQTGAILKDAPHPEGAKLLHNFILGNEYQAASGGWSVRSDLPPPQGLPDIMNMPGTNPTTFKEWMMDRAKVERLRFFFEDKIGTAQGKSPLDDDL